MSLKDRLVMIFCQFFVEGDEAIDVGQVIVEDWPNPDY